MAVEELVSRAIFATAVREGDLSTARRYLSQPSVVAGALRIEAFLTRNGRATLLQPGQARLAVANVEDEIGRAWFHCEQYEFEFIRWLCASTPPREVERFPLSVAFVLVNVMGVVVRMDSPQLLETLLTSYSFCELFHDEEREAVLQDAVASLGELVSSKMLEILLAHGAKPNLEVERPGFLFHRGARSTPSTTLSRLVENGLCIVGQSAALEWSVRSNAREEWLAELVALGTDPEGLIHLAFDRHRMGLIRALYYDTHADIDARDTEGRTVLMKTLERRGTDVDVLAIKFLLRVGADPNLRDFNGRTAVARAVTSRIELLRLVMDTDVDPNVADNDGLTPLHHVGGAGGSMFESAALLIRHGADLRARDKDGSTPLHTLLSFDNVENDIVATVILMLEHGADPNAQDNDGETPLSLWLNRNGDVVAGGSEVSRLLRRAMEFSSKRAPIEAEIPEILPQQRRVERSHSVKFDASGGKKCEIM